MSSSGRRGDNIFDGKKFWPSITKAPTTSLRKFDGDFSSSVQTGSASFDISIKSLADEYPGIEDHRWGGSDVSLTYVDEAGNDELIFVGKITRFGEKNGVLAVTATVNEEPFRADVLSAEYAGTTGIEGGEDNKGNPKPLIFGRAKNVAPVQINVVDNVFQVSAYGPVRGIPSIYERGASFGARIGDYATYEDLVAADIPEGRWATCLASGLFRLGAPPYGTITADVDGLVRNGVWLRRTGAIIKALSEMAGVSSWQIDTESLVSLDSAVPYDVNIVISGQIDVISIAQRMALPCNAQAGIDLLGRIFVTRVTIGSPLMTLNGEGKNLPPVIDIAESSVRPPYKRIVMGAERSWRVHSFDEIAFTSELIERGTYEPDIVYREGNIVDLPDGSRWVFTGVTPSKNSYPAIGNANWNFLSAETDIHAIGGQVVTEGPVFPDYDVEAQNDIHIDAYGRRYVLISIEDGELLFDGKPLLFNGDTLFQGWRRVDPSARIGGEYGIPILNSSGDNTVDSDLLNNSRRAVRYSEEAAIDVDAIGNILTEFPLEIPITSYIGNTNNSADTSFTVSFPAGITGQINNTPGIVSRGNLLINSFEAQGPIKITATFPDGLVERSEINLPVRIGSLPMAGGSGSTMVQDYSWNNVPSGSAGDIYVQVTDDPLIVQSDSSGDLKFRFYSTFTGVNGANVNAVAKYRPEASTDPADWVNAGSAIDGTAVVVVSPSANPFEPEPGYTNPGYVNQAEFTADTGSVDTNYQVALFVKRSAGSGAIVFNSSNNIFSVKQ